MLAAYLAEERSDEVSYPRFLGGLIIVGVAGAAGDRPARPRVGVGADRDGDGHAARRRRQGRSTSCSITFLSLATVACRVHRPSGQRLPARADAGVLRPGQPGPCAWRRPSTRSATPSGHRHRRHLSGKGWLQGPADQQRATSRCMWADFPFAAVGEQFGLVGCARAARAVRHRSCCGSGGSPRCRATCSARTSAPACSRC